MALFRKRKQDEIEDGVEAPEDELDVEDGTGEDLEVPQARVPLTRPTGPWDLSDLPADDATQRLDLGALRVPVPEGLEVRVELNEAGAVVAATLVSGDSSAQISVFAAPRTEGIWAEVVEEISDSVREGGGRASTGEGPFGPELEAVVPTQTDRGVVQAEARFLGVDGPRWFLRALVTGPAARDRAAAAPLEAAIRGIAVDRGTDPMAVREALPLTLPAEAEQARQEQLAQQPDLSLPERGPEITEVR